MRSNPLVFPDNAAIARRAAEYFVVWALEAVAIRGRFSVALSGGSTPRALYTYLALPEFSSRIPWESVYLFWGDERCVPPEHSDSNYRMAVESLLSQIPIPAKNIHRILGELTPEQAAKHYEIDLRSFFGDDPAFDLVLLGLGDDGHTASLFPGSTELSGSQGWVVSVEHTIPPPPLVSRVTLTPRVINAARRVLFLASGAGKARRLADVLNGPYQPQRLPAQIINPQNGELVWLVDKSAAAALGGQSE